MSTAAYDKYRQSAIQTATPAQLLLSLFDGAIRFTKTGLKNMEDGHIERINLNFGKAQDIVSELSVSLDHSYDISNSLAALYDYIKYLLIESNIKKDRLLAEEALGYLIDLRQTWAEASRSAVSPLGQHG
ncbi:flagellar protein FliS [Paenibacillaceae bacterium GAS479]|nr:flagellar protein FliS [Paenibacillaceae bacterium GAS479]